MVEPKSLSINSLFKALIGFQSKNSPATFPLDEEWRATFLQIIAHPRDLDITPGPIQAEILSLLALANDHTLFITDLGHIGLSYQPNLDNGIRTGDLVVGLFGVNYPFLLRPVTTGYEMINVAHVAGHEWGHGFVEQGEVSGDWTELEQFGLREFTIV